MICNETVRRFCCEDISNIENYDKAMTDMEHTWHCHHRLEIGKNGEVISMNDLKKYGLYYNRPASELIFLTRSEHRSIHNKGIAFSEEHKSKISCALKGKLKSNDAKKNMSESHKGNKHTDETRRKMSKARKGKPKSDEAKKKLSEALKAYWAKKKIY